MIPHPICIISLRDNFKQTRNLKHFTPDNEWIPANLNLITIATLQSQMRFQAVVNVQFRAVKCAAGVNKVLQQFPDDLTTNFKNLSFKKAGNLFDASLRNCIIKSWLEAVTSFPLT